MADMPENDLETQWKTMMAVIERSAPLFQALARIEIAERMLERATQDLIAQGKSPDEAKALAMAALNAP